MISLILQIFLYLFGGTVILTIGCFFWLIYKYAALHEKGYPDGRSKCDLCQKGIYNGSSILYKIYDLHEFSPKDIWINDTNNKTTDISPKLLKIIAEKFRCIPFSQLTDRSCLNIRICRECDKTPTGEELKTKYSNMRYD